MSHSVLAHIASTIAQKENLATNALAYILNRSPAARTALHRQMVDLMLHAADGATLGYIEAKFWAALTSSQPVEYIRRLAESGGVLVILAPEQRLPTLRAEMLERIKEPTPTNLTDEVMQVGSVRVGLLSWRRLLDALKEAVKDEHHKASDVQQLDGLVRRFETDGFIPLTRVDIYNQELPRLALALASLLPDVVDGAVKPASSRFKERGPRTTLGRPVATSRSPARVAGWASTIASGPSTDAARCGFASTPTNGAVQLRCARRYSSGPRWTRRARMSTTTMARCACLCCCERASRGRPWCSMR